MPLEGAPRGDKKEKKLSGALEIGFLAAALLAAHPEAQALEIAPNTDWTTGIQRNVRESVLEKRIEHAVVYLQFTDGTGTWLPIIKGKATSINIDFEQENKKMAEARGQKQKQVQKMCVLHTHPTTNFETMGMEESKLVMAPPSPDDIRLAAWATAYYAQFGAGKHNLVYIAADSQGVWYHEHAGKPQDRLSSVTIGRPRESTGDKLWQQTYDKFAWASTEPSFNFKQEFPALKKAYKQHLSANVRFVPYSEVSKEPACAGVDYKSMPTVVASSNVQ